MSHAARQRGLGGTRVPTSCRCTPSFQQNQAEDASLLLICRGVGCPAGEHRGKSSADRNMPLAMPCSRHRWRIRRRLARDRSRFQQKSWMTSHLIEVLEYHVAGAGSGPVKSLNGWQHVSIRRLWLDSSARSAPGFPHRYAYKEYNCTCSE